MRGGPRIFPTIMPGAGLSIRFAAFYGAIFLALGIYLPFWPVWLADRGLNAADIGLLLAFTAWVRALSLPPIARLADHLGRVKAAIALLALLSLISFTAFLAAGDFWSILVVQLLTAVTFHSLIPLTESHAMRAVGAQGLDYGRIRLWGSITFIVGSLGAGFLLNDRAPMVLLWLVLGALAATFLAALCLPEQQTKHREAAAKPGFRVLLADRALLLFFLAAGLLQASHAVYYGFSALSWRESGLSDTAIGWLWAEGVLAEIAFFAVSGSLFRQRSPVFLLSLAALGGLVRWTVLASTASLPTLIAVQGLHALTFGAAHLATMLFIARRVPESLSATAQGLYAAISGGLVMGLVSLMAGGLYDAFQAQAFYAMAVLSVAGLILAWTLSRMPMCPTRPS